MVIRFVWTVYIVAVWLIGAKHPMLQLKRLFFAHPLNPSMGCSFTTSSWPLFCCNSKGVFSRTFHGMFFYYRFQIVAIFLPLLHVFLFVVLNTCPANLSSSLSERFAHAMVYVFGNPVYGKRPAPGCSCSEQGYLHTFGCGYTRLQRSVKRARNDCFLS